MPKAKGEHTSASLTSKTGKLLPMPSATKAMKAVAASALTQASNKAKTKAKKHK